MLSWESSWAPQVQQLPTEGKTARCGCSCERETTGQLARYDHFRAEHILNKPVKTARLWILNMRPRQDVQQSPNLVHRQDILASSPEQYIQANCEKLNGLGIRKLHRWHTLQRSCSCLVIFAIPSLGIDIERAINNNSSETDNGQILGSRERGAQRLGNERPRATKTYSCVMPKVCDFVVRAIRPCAPTTA